jgi:hypothetical protein
MTDYRRNFMAGGSFFFTVNLANRRLRLLTEHIDELRAAFRETRRRHPFTIDAIVVLPARGCDGAAECVIEPVRPAPPLFDLASP